MESVLKYKTFDSLLADVMVDFKTFSQDNLVEPQELIRVAKWCTTDLGLRVYKTKEVLIEINHHKAKLPYDFYVFNWGLMCGEGMIKISRPQGITTMQVPYTPALDAPQTAVCEEGCPAYTCDNCGQCGECSTGLVVVPGYNPLQPIGDPCIQPRVFMDCKGDSFELVQILQTETRRWKYMLPLRLVSNGNDVSCNCPNLYSNSVNHIWIKDGFIHSNIECAKFYINYEGMLEDEDGTLLVPDHDKITEYYVYKLKHKILENLFMNGEDVEKRLAYIRGELRAARIEAWTTVRMPNFKEMVDLWRLNRRLHNVKYVNMFKSCGWLSSEYNGRIWGQ